MDEAALDLEPERTPLRLSLIENAYDSLNESLACVERAYQDPTRWKLAVLHLVHSVELIIKQRLLDEHELLIWEDVDRPGKTVSLEKSLVRLGNIHAGLDDSDLAGIRTAIRWRNTITHYEVDLIAEEVRENYLLIFEFLDSFHVAHFETSLSEKIIDEHVETAMGLAEDFRKEFLEYRGRVMHRRWPRRLIAAQRTLAVHQGGKEYLRIPWGSESDWSRWKQFDVDVDFCSDCAAAIGEYHGPYCDQEECPCCGGQMLSCECEFEPSELWGLEAGDDLTNFEAEALDNLLDGSGSPSRLT